LTTANVLIIACLFISALLLAAGLFFLYYRQVRVLLAKSRSQSKLSQCLKAVNDFDECLDNGDLEGAALLINKIPYFDIPASSEILSVLRSHHQDLLARCVELSERMNTRPSNIAQLESLFSERGDLLQLVFKARYSFETLMEKRGVEGKSIPLWTQAEFEKKEEEIREALCINKDKLKRELESFTSNLKNAPKGEALIH